MRCLVGLLVALVSLAATAEAVAAEVPKPPIVWRPIPFSTTRLGETTAYVQRHYGRGGWQLRMPKVIVEHYTASSTFSSAWNAFASDAPDRELHETPGICAHFVIDRDGTIYQLVRLNIVCRHTVGLNDRAIGIEHVGTSDAQVLGNSAQMRSSLALTAWLMNRYGIRLGDVIGHNESLTSRFHHERYAAWRCQTHGDFPASAMTLYRSRLGKTLKRAGVPTGGPVRHVRPRCG